MDVLYIYNVFYLNVESDRVLNLRNWTIVNQKYYSTPIIRI